jgi:tetratricopeptide (TPR) repeat protein
VVRARYWYEQAVGTLSGFTKTRVEKRIKDADQLLGRADGSGDKPTPVPPVKDPYAQNMQMGQYWFKVGNYPRAVESFTAALKVKPDDPKASEALKQSQYYLYMAAGYQRANLGDFQGAGQMFAKALEEKPDDQAATSALAALEQAMKGGGIFKTRGKGMGGK